MPLNALIIQDFSDKKTLPKTMGMAVSEKPKLGPAEALDLLFREYAPNTRRAYARAFRQLQEWAQVRSLEELRQVDSLRLLEYKQHLKGLGWKPASVNQSMSALRKIFKVLTEFGHLPENPIQPSVLRTEKVAAFRNKGALQISQLNAMLEANERLDYDARMAPLLRQRNALLLKFLYLTAARRSEAAGLQWNNIQPDGQYHVIVLQETKSGAPQRIKLRWELNEGLQEWRRMLQEHGVNSLWVFPSLGFRTRGGAMSGKGVNDVVARLGRAVGLNISAHYLRHTAITLALELGEPLQKVQSYARHASANTTIRYYHDQQFLERNPTDRLPMI
jgi:integrase